ncbi:MAG: substrate-binding domain-containing protein [Bacteroidia bacterium]|nr:substrate-binding domain-containing protein [Bacteroidia bacterium]
MKPQSSKINRINGDARTPKYRQMIDILLWEIGEQVYPPGHRIPSINETSEAYLLSRDTVEKAYRELCQRGVLRSIPGKGYYVSSRPAGSQLKILLIFNKFSNYKRLIYNTFVQTLGDRAVSTVYVHGFNAQLFQRMVLENLGLYDYYVIMPHFYRDSHLAEAALRKIPPHKLLLLDRSAGLPGKRHGLICQDFALDLEEALCSGMDLMARYRRLRLVFPESQDFPYPPEIKTGFLNFCRRAGIEGELLAAAEPEPVQAGDAYIVIEEADLIDLIKKSQAAGLRLGQDLGLISYNDTPIKEILAGGITVVSTDHAAMGRRAAAMILQNKRSQERNPFRLIRRNSL